jgi:anthranilate phosphoribosyltransferase
MKNILEKLLEKVNLSTAEAYELMDSIISGKYTDIQIGGLIIALRSKGETVEEITGFAKAMREKMVKLPLSVPAIDMCGTGGDALGTFNISTAACFVVAGAEVRVAKHGNRSMTSKSGSADVLQALDIDINKSVESSMQDIEEIGLGFMFAPSYHPAMKYAVNPRKELAVKTVFNILGPLCNPATVNAQAMGTFNPSLTEVQARVLNKLGSQEVLVFHGYDGLDEITTTTTTKISQIQNNGKLSTYDFDAQEAGLERATIEQLKGGEPKVNAKIILDVLSGEKGPKRDIVLINAAAGIIVGKKAKTFSEGIKFASDSINSGAALGILKKLKK